MTTDDKAEIKFSSIILSIPLSQPLLHPHPHPIANQITLNTTSIPFSSAPLYLYVHIPSLLTSQYAPDAECIPLRPADPCAAVAVCVEDEESVAVEPVPFEAGSEEEEEVEGTGGSCWTIVLFTLKR